MPYVVKKGKGDKPFLIVNQKTGQVVGHSDNVDKANRSIGYRMAAESKNIKKFKRKVDNKMHKFGETDLAKGIVRVNKSKKINGRGEIIDSIVHEKTHILHPQMKEKNVQKRTTKTLKKMTRKQKGKSYSLFNS